MADFYADITYENSQFKKVCQDKFHDMRVVSIYTIAYILKTIGIIAILSPFFKVIVFKFSGLKIENQFFDQKHIFRIPPHN